MKLSVVNTDIGIRTMCSSVVPTLYGYISEQIASRRNNEKYLGLGLEFIHLS